MKFRKFKEKDIKQIAKVKNSAFSDFNKSEYFEKDAISRYLNYTDPKKSNRELLGAFNINKDSIFYVAEENDKVLGYIKGKKDRIGNLFVLGKAHKKGIGRRLVNLLETEAKKQHSKKIKICSSIYAVPFYQRMGYKKTTGIRNFHGLRIQPMKKII
jgi:predicted N-acetyltransferase YhbS